MIICSLCGYRFSKYQLESSDFDHRCNPKHTWSIDDAIIIANSERTNDSPIGLCLWYNRVCELVK